MFVRNSGEVVIGVGAMPTPNGGEQIPTPTNGIPYRLFVDGAVLARELIVNTSWRTFPDYVFEDGYSLMDM